MVSRAERLIESRPVGVSTSALGSRLTAASLVFAGVCFVLYPAIRPFSDEVSMHGAQAFASTAWLIAHTLAMIGFILLTVGLFGMYTQLREKGHLAATGLVSSMIGVGLTLPYYGAEVFGLHAVGQAVVNRNDVSLMSIVNSIRWEAGIWFILIGLALLGIGTILFAVAIWRSGSLPKWSGIPLAIGFALFIPQFVATQPVRIAHGFLILVGSALVAWAIAMRGTPASE